jgi:hypothetical protein
MNVLTIKTRVRRLFGDESGTFLEDSDLYAWINEALTEIHRINRVSKTFFNVLLIANINTYALPTDFLAMDKVFMNGTELAYINVANSELNSITSDGLDCPVGSYILYNRNLILPAVSISPSVLCRIVYTASPPKVTSDIDEPTSTPEEYHELIIRYCMARASEMSEELNAADRYQNMFKMGLIEMRGEVKAPVEDSYPSVGFWGDDY